jgi:transmembrane sensor
MSSKARKEASRWLLRLQSEGISPEDVAAFKAWYRADPGHAAAFDRLTNVVGRLRQLKGGLYAEPAPARIAFSRSRRSMLAAATGAALAASFVGIAWLVVAPRPENENLAFETALGTQRQIKLTDGSQVELNTSTRLEVRMSASRRHVELKNGEALFTVARDTERPFEVEAGGYVMRAVGTAFCVRLDAGAPSLLVIEGVVSAAQEAGASRLVVAGERLDLSSGIRTSALSTKEIERTLAWRRGMLEFDRAPLSAVVAEVERYTDAHFTFADPALADLPMVTYFRAADLEGFISRLEKSYSLLGVRPTAEGYLIYRRPEADR